MNDQSTDFSEKKATLEKLLEGDHIFIHLDASRDDVVVPAGLKGDQRLTLKLSRLFQGNTEVSLTQISVELLFPEGYFTCLIPLSSIWGVTSDTGKSMFWPEAAPREILQMVIRTMADDAAAEQSSEDSAVTPRQEAEPQPAKKSNWPVRPLLSPLEGGHKGEGDSEKGEKSSAKGGNPHLKRIK